MAIRSGNRCHDRTPVPHSIYPVSFPLFLYVLAVSNARITRKLCATDGEQSVWLQTLGGICLIIRLISLGFGAFIGGLLVFRTDNPTPLTITSTTGIILIMIEAPIISLGRAIESFSRIISGLNSQNYLLEAYTHLSVSESDKTYLRIL